jgi:hypothetical protein
MMWNEAHIIADKAKLDYMFALDFPNVLTIPPSYTSLTTPPSNTSPTLPGNDINNTLIRRIVRVQIHFRKRDRKFSMFLKLILKEISRCITEEIIKM